MLLLGALILIHLFWHWHLYLTLPAVSGVPPLVILIVWPEVPRSVYFGSTRGGNEMEAALRRPLQWSNYASKLLRFCGKRKLLLKRHKDNSMTRTTVPRFQSLQRLLFEPVSLVLPPPVFLQFDLQVLGHLLKLSELRLKTDKHKACCLLSYISPIYLPLSWLPPLPCSKQMFFF